MTAPRRAVAARVPDTAMWPDPDAGLHVPAALDRDDDPAALMRHAMAEEAAEVRHAEAVKAFDRIGGICALAGLDRTQRERWGLCRCEDGLHEFTRTPAWSPSWAFSKAEARQWVAHHRANGKAWHLVVTRQLDITTGPMEVPAP